MPGASDHTRKVSNLNANWVPGPEGTDGRFEVLIVTDDGHQHVLAPSAAAMTALIALTRAPAVLAWDPSNLIGTMPWTEDR